MSTKDEPGTWDQLGRQGTQGRDNGVKNQGTEETFREANGTGVPPQETWRSHVPNQPVTNSRKGKYEMDYTIWVSYRRPSAKTAQAVIDDIEQIITQQKRVEGRTQ